MRGTKGARREAIPLCIKPERGQVPEYVSEPVGEEAGYVLQEDVTWSNLANDSGDFGPEPPLIVLGGALPGEADGLAGEAGGDDVDALGAGVDVPDVAVAVDVGPVPAEDPAAELVTLAEPSGSHPGPFEAEVDPADPAE